MKSWLFSTILRYWRAITLLLVIQSAGALLVSLQPFYFQRIVTIAAAGSRAELIDQGAPLVMVLAAIYLAGAALQGTGGYVACAFSSNLLNQLQSDFFEQTGRLPLSFFQRQDTGEYFTKFNHDLGQVQGFIAGSVPAAVREAITALTVTAILFCSCPAALTGAALAIIVLTSLAAARLSGTMARYAQAQRRHWGEINRVFDETVEGIDTCKIFAAEAQRGELFRQRTGVLRDLSVKAGSVAAVFSPAIELISRLGGLALIVLAYAMISRGTLALATFLLFFFYAALLQGAVSSLLGLLSAVQPQLVGIRNIHSLFAESGEGGEPASSPPLDGPVAIEISGLIFSYPGGRQLFRGAELQIPARGITVVHGPSGSGKSTLINLLLRFHAPQRGSIRLGGAEIERFSRAELRRKIGIVAQQHFIFQESLRANLLLAKPQAQEGELIDALQRAHLGEFLRQSSAGADRMMGPRGKGLSAGERQRICIARLFLKGAPVMVLDEPWSNLDEEARRTLAEVLNECKATTTILILTHEELPGLAVDRVYRLVPELGQFVREDRESGE